jgi:hypothetical protein
VFVRHSLEKYSVGGPDYVLIRDLNENAIRVIGSILGQSVALDHYTVEVNTLELRLPLALNMRKVLRTLEWEFNTGGCRFALSPARLGEPFQSLFVYFSSACNALQRGAYHREMRLPIIHPIYCA